MAEDGHMLAYRLGEKNRKLIPLVVERCRYAIASTCGVWARQEVSTVPHQVGVGAVGAAAAAIA